MKYLFFSLLLIFGFEPGFCQQFFFPPAWYADSATLEEHIPMLAKTVIGQYSEPNAKKRLDHFLDLEVAVKDYPGVVRTLDSFSVLITRDTAVRRLFLLSHRVYAMTSIACAGDSSKPFLQKYTDILTGIYGGLLPENRYSGYFDADVDIEGLRSALQESIHSRQHRGADSIGLADALALFRNWADWVVHRNTWQIDEHLYVQLEKQDFIYDDSVLLTIPDGATISVTTVRKRSVDRPLPVVLMYSIYPGQDHYLARQAALKGYAGVVANTRGKRLSREEPEPYEHDAKDAYSIIDWISKQSWCNGKIGMYGGSYLGFAQWSALKYPHPALKTIVPEVAVGAGVDFPALNGIYGGGILQWLHFVVNNKNVDYDDYSNPVIDDGLVPAG
jgi:uncharacterized protein